MQSAKISNSISKSKHYKILGAQAVWVFGVPIAWIFRLSNNQLSWDLFTEFWTGLSVVWIIGCVLIYKFVK